ncbi:autophagy protein 13 [Lobaria immixta]|nr:autophagy protein 13 [Lobaria immixta]
MGEGSDALMRGQEVTVQGRDTLAKLSQIIQNYFTKAALIILHARFPLPPAYAKGSATRRVNKWFNVELDETDVTREDLRIWKNSDAVDSRPPVMIIETYIDTEELTNNQSLVIIDEQGRRWDVEEALNTSPSSSAGGGSQPTGSEVILERWQIQLDEPSVEIPKDLAQILPRTYKNSIVLFRSLFTYAKLLPAWKLSKKLSKPRSAHSPPKLKYRIREESSSEISSKRDSLTLPLYETTGHVIENFEFDPIDSPAGALSIHVSYRSNCEFRIADSEALLSSHFMGMDERFFEPSLGRKHSTNQKDGAPRVEVGSLPPRRTDIVERPGHGQAYGSMSTFHQVGPPTGSSPLSVLRAARDMGSQSPTDRQSLKAPSSNRSAQGSRSSLRSADGAPTVGRRPSVSFMPFKTPSLSASPLQTEQMAPPLARGSLGRTSTLGSLAEVRTPSALGPRGSVPSRGSPVAQEQAVTSSGSSSPKPAPTRYSSSFGRRKAKLSSGGGSRTDDDNNSSGKASIASSVAQPGSEILAEGGGASSGSIATDDDNISDFLKMLDQKKDLKSFRAPSDKASADASTRRTTAALTKFQRMRDSNAALSDSMSSSLLLHRSSSSSSRQLSSVPPMVAGTSISTESSPGKPISPHTPHTPAIPSRLSANSIIEYPHRSSSSGEDRLLQRVEPRREERSRTNSSRDPNTGAIDIPTSPRPFHPNYRRSSSVAQQPRTLVIEDELDIFPFGLRSASLGADERPQLSISALAGLQESSAEALPNVGHPGPPFGPVPNPEECSGAPMTRQQSSSLEGREETGSLPQRGLTYRPRIGRGSGRGHTPPHGSLSSLADRGSGSGSSDQRGGRYSYTRPASTFEEEEPLLFAMSDFGAIQQSRRSLEEARGGSSAGASDRGGGDSGASSRRGSRKSARPDSTGRVW